MHVVTGEIRKAPKVLDNGTYIVEIAESYKDKDGNRQYTNYAFFFASKTDGQRNYHANVFQVGKVITVSFEQAKVQNREHNGTIYSTIQAAGFAKLDFSQFTQDGNQQGWGQPQQPQTQQRQQQTKPQPQMQNEPPMDFDNDIPF